MVEDYSPRCRWNVVCLALPIHLEHITQHNVWVVIATQTTSIPGPLKHNWCWCSKKIRIVKVLVGILHTFSQWMQKRAAILSESFSSVIVESKLPAGCCWEGATLRLISGQWFGTKWTSLAHQWAHFPSFFTLTCTAAPWLWVSLRARARKKTKQEVNLPASGPSPIVLPANSDLCDYRRNRLK